MSERGDNTERFGDELARLNARLANLARRNLLSEAVQAEYLYRDLLNGLYGWDLVDANGVSSNFEAVDLVDVRAKVAVQVSVTCDEGKVRKVNETLAKDAMRRYAEEGYRVAFCFIGEQGDKVKASKAIRNPHGVRFDQRADVLHTADLMAAFVALGPRGQREALHVVDGAGHEDFYEWVCDRFFGDLGGELIGDVPLSECYIEPTVDVLGEGGSYLTAREWVESFVAGDDAVAVLCGEPGHGKTSLCRKAVADFYKEGWLAGRVSNVFCFSLNPANTDTHSGESFRLAPLLSWGDYRESSMKPRGCENALVFLDGYDELLEQRPGDLEDFVIDHVLKLAGSTKARVVITTRSSVVDSSKDAYDLGEISVPVVRLRALTKEQQLEWIRGYMGYLGDRLSPGKEPPASERRKELEGELSELGQYCEDYERLDVGDDLRSVLGIPIVFRMAVAARYLPRDEGSMPRMYDRLFEAVWKRYEGLGVKLSQTERKRMGAARRKLSRHALRVFVDDAQTAVVKDVPRSPWVFSFYTRHEGDGTDGERSCVGFLHRSIYQFFLAREVLSWFGRCAGGEDDDATFCDNLSYLARRRLDETTFEYIRDMHDGIEDKEILDVAFDKAYAILKETDGILPPPNDKRDAILIKAITPLERANNVFWNVVSVCSVCGHEVTADKVNERALQSYRLDGCHMENARLEGVDIRAAYLKLAHLRKARLDEADLRGSHLEGAYLGQARLGRARLIRADLAGASFEGAHLEGAYFGWADLRRADLRGAHLEEAHLMSARLAGTHFTNKAALGHALLENEIFEDAVFEDDGSGLQVLETSDCD